MSGVHSNALDLIGSYSDDDETDPDSADDTELLIPVVKLLERSRSDNITNQAVNEEAVITKKELTSGRNEELTSDHKEELTSDCKEELTSDRKEELTSDCKEELTSDRKEELTSDHKEELTSDRKEELTSDCKEETPVHTVADEVVMQDEVPQVGMDFTVDSNPREESACDQIQLTECHVNEADMNSVTTIDTGRSDETQVHNNIELDAGPCLKLDSSGENIAVDSSGITHDRIKNAVDSQSGQMHALLTEANMHEKTLQLTNETDKTAEVQTTVKEKEACPIEEQRSHTNFQKSEVEEHSHSIEQPICQDTVQHDSHQKSSDIVTDGHKRQFPLVSSKEDFSQHPPQYCGNEHGYDQHLYDHQLCSQQDQQWQQHYDPSVQHQSVNDYWQGTAVTSEHQHQGSQQQYSQQADPQQYSQQADPQQYSQQADPQQYSQQADPQQYSQQADSQQYSQQADPQQYSQQADPQQYLQQTDPQQYSQQADPQQYLQQTDPQQYSQQTDPQQYSHHADPQQYSQHADLQQYSQQTDPQQYSQQADPQQYLQQADSQQYSQQADPQQYSQQADPQQYLQQTDPQQYSQQADPQQYSHHADPQQYSQHADPQQYSQQADPQQYSQHADPQQYSQQADPQQYSQQADPQQYSQHTDPQQYSQQADPQQYSQQADPQQYSQQADPQQYSQQADPQQYSQQADPQQYSQQADPQQYSQQADPQQYSQQADPQQYSQQADPQQYSQQADPQQYSQQADPQQYSQHTDPQQYSQQADPQQYSQQADPQQYSHHADPQQYSQQADPQQYIHSNQPHYVHSQHEQHQYAQTNEQLCMQYPEQQPYSQPNPQHYVQPDHHLYVDSERQHNAHTMSKGEYSHGYTQQQPHDSHHYYPPFDHHNPPYEHQYYGSSHQYGQSGPSGDNQEGRNVVGEYNSAQDRVHEQSGQYHHYPGGERHVPPIDYREAAYHDVDHSSPREYYPEDYDHRNQPCAPFVNSRPYPRPFPLYDRGWRRGRGRGSERGRPHLPQRDWDEYRPLNYERWGGSYYDGREPARTLSPRPRYGSPAGDFPRDSSRETGSPDTRDRTCQQPVLSDPRQRGSPQKGSQTTGESNDSQKKQIDKHEKSSESEEKHYTKSAKYTKLSSTLVSTRPAMLKVGNSSKVARVKPKGPQLIEPHFASATSPKPKLSDKVEKSRAPVKLPEASTSSKALASFKIPKHKTVKVTSETTTSKVAVKIPALDIPQTHREDSAQSQSQESPPKCAVETTTPKHTSAQKRILDTTPPRHSLETSAAKHTLESTPPKCNIERTPPKYPLETATPKRNLKHTLETTPSRCALGTTSPKCALDTTLPKHTLETTAPTAESDCDSASQVSKALPNEDTTAPRRTTPEPDIKTVLSKESKVAKTTTKSTKRSANNLAAINLDADTLQALTTIVQQTLKMAANKGMPVAKSIAAETVPSSTTTTSAPVQTSVTTTTVASNAGVEVSKGGKDVQRHVSTSAQELTSSHLVSVSTSVEKPTVSLSTTTVKGPTSVPGQHPVSSVYKAPQPVLGLSHLLQLAAEISRTKAGAKKSDLPTSGSKTHVSSVTTAEQTTATLSTVPQLRKASPGVVLATVIRGSNPHIISSAETMGKLSTVVGSDMSTKAGSANKQMSTDNVSSKGGKTTDLKQDKPDSRPERNESKGTTTMNLLNYFNADLMLKEYNLRQSKATAHQNESPPKKIKVKTESKVHGSSFKRSETIKRELSQESEMSPKSKRAKICVEGESVKLSKSPANSSEQCSDSIPVSTLISENQVELQNDVVHDKRGKCKSSLRRKTSVQRRKSQSQKRPRLDGKDDTINNENRTTDLVCAFCHQKDGAMNLGFLYGPYKFNSVPPDLSNLENTDRSKDGIENNAVKHPSELWVHEDCAVWAPGVCLVGGQLIGLKEAAADGDKMVCQACRRTGATLCCSVRGCKTAYHYPCAQETGCILKEEQFLISCSKHKGTSAT